MPVYERRCLECDEVFPHLCGIADREKPMACKLCGHPETKSIMSATPTTFKFHDAKAIKRRVDRQHGFGRLTGKDAKYYKDKHNMTPARNPRREE